MKLPLWLRRWRALRVPELTASTPEGATVQATGIVNAVENTLLAPMSGLPCVVVLTTYTMPSQQPQVRQPGLHPRVEPTVVDRLQARRFELATATLRVTVEPSAVELLLPARASINMTEVMIQDGDRITVVGSVLRGGGERPTANSAFREDRPTCMLVGGPSHPIVITASASSRALRLFARRR